MEIKGIAPFPTHHFLSMSINVNNLNAGDLHLPQNKPKDIGVSLSTNQINILFFLWYFILKVDSTKNYSARMRFKNIEERWDGNAISFMFEKYIYRFTPRLYEALFRKSIKNRSEK